LIATIARFRTHGIFEQEKLYVEKAVGKLCDPNIGFEFGNPKKKTRAAQLANGGSRYLQLQGTSKFATRD
jgi:hypothetical protein